MGEPCQTDRSGVAASRRQREELGVGRAPDMRHRIGEIAGDEPKQGARGARALGRAEACDQFRQALTMEPQDADLRFKLGSALMLAARPREAARELREAVRLRSDWPEALNALAWLLATTPDQSLRAPEEALRFALRASKLARDRNPEILDTVAAAQAATGRFDEATGTARQAADLAAAAHANGLARMIQNRARLYEQRTGYIEAPARSVLRPR